MNERQKMIDAFMCGWRRGAIGMAYNPLYESQRLRRAFKRGYHTGVADALKAKVFAVRQSISG